MARPQELHENHRVAGTIRAVVLFLLTLVVIGSFAYSSLKQRPQTRSADEFCKQVATLSTFSQALADLNLTAVRAAIPALEQLDQIAPLEIQPNVRVILDTSRSLIPAIEEAQTDESAALDRAWRPKQADVGHIQAAGKAVHDYTMATCKLDLSAVTTTTAAPTTTSTAAPKPAPAAKAPSSTAPPTTKPKGIVGHATAATTPAAPATTAAPATG